jgi:uncharacterized membrane protein
MKRMTTKQIALTSTFAALIIVITRLPGVPILGGLAQGGGSVEISVVLYPIMGIVLGPLMGLTAALLGNLIAWIIPSSSIFGLLLIPAGAIAAFVSGCLSRDRKWLNWKASALVLLILNGLWYVSPVGSEAPFYPILHIVALALVLIMRRKIYHYISGSHRNKIVLGTAISTYAAIMSDHMVGNLAWISSIGLVIPLKAVKDAFKVLGMIWLKTGIYIPDNPIGGIFMLILPISAVERIIYTIVATALGVGLIQVIGWGRLIIETRRPMSEQKQVNN